MRKIRVYAGVRYHERHPPPVLRVFTGYPFSSAVRGLPFVNSFCLKGFPQAGSVFEDDSSYTHGPGLLHIRGDIIHVENLIGPHVRPFENRIVYAPFRFPRTHFKGEYPFVHELDDRVMFENVGKVELVRVARARTEGIPLPSDR